MNDYKRGNPNADVVLLEYADYECPYCAMAEPYVKEIAERFHDDLAIVFRPFPLMQVHPHAMHAAQAAEAAGLQQRFWEMHDILFEHQRQLDDESLIRYAEAIHLDVARFKRDFGSHAVIDTIRRSVTLGEEQGVEGTPSFFLDGKALDVSSYEELIEVVANAVRRHSKAHRS